MKNEIIKKLEGILQLLKNEGEDVFLQKKTVAETEYFVLETGELEHGKYHYEVYYKDENMQSSLVNKHMITMPRKDYRIDFFSKVLDRHVEQFNRGFYLANKLNLNNN